MHTFLKNSFFLIALILLIFVGYAPAKVGLEITPMYGYQFGGYLPTYKGNIDVSNTANYGISLTIETNSLQRGTAVELSYSLQPARLTYRSGYENEIQEQFDVAVEYYQIGGVYEQELNGKMLRGFGLLSLGATRFAPEPANYRDEWFFSAALGIGLKAFLSPRLGLRFQGRMLMPMRWTGGGIWCSPGGCNMGVGTGSVILQADVSAGVIIRF